jgi:hypothetical protein
MVGTVALRKSDGELLTGHVQASSAAAASHGARACCRRPPSTRTASVSPPAPQSPARSAASSRPWASHSHPIPANARSNHLQPPFQRHCSSWVKRGCRVSAADDSTRRRRAGGDHVQISGGRPWTANGERRQYLTHRRVLQVGVSRMTRSRRSHTSMAARFASSCRSRR